MAFGPKDFVTPAAAFTMAVTVIFYVRYAISTSRSEAHIRRAGALRPDHPQAPESSKPERKGDA
ncbi:unnamed protein product [Somion occarium]|uniref:Uncharacterized protein n=1 Tax=Somion occarium TaxID=3059160 RepID=A0ABP1E4S7_9APHY